MFFVEEAVFSKLHGYGRVIEPGEDPLVGFLSGRNLRVAGEHLRLVTDEKYDAVLANKIAVEQWMHRRIYGEPLAEKLFTPLRRVARPLAERMVEAEMRLVVGS